MRASRTRAVSPVVGIMLMIVVVIIIAAVVAGFAGGLVSPTKKAPSIVLDVKIVNNGFWYAGSGFYATVTGISRPVPTSELRIVTSWTITNKTTGERETGGSTVVPLKNNVDHYSCFSNAPRSILNPTTAPFGTGPGVSVDGSHAEPGAYPGEMFGGYTLEPGTGISAPAQHCTCACYYSSNGYCKNGICTNAYGGTGQYSYGPNGPHGFDGAPYTDGATAVLGQNWNDLRPGDTVNVKVIHLPTNSIIFDKNILVMG